MATSKRSNEGYLMIDSRQSPSLTPEMVHSISPELPLTAGRGLFEAPTITCSHCQRVVVINPLRTRERGYCPKCDHYVCDTCNAVRIQTGKCKTFNQRIEEEHERVIKSQGFSQV